MRVEHQGRQLDAITQRLCQGIPQPSDTDRDALTEPFGDLLKFEEFDTELSSNGSMRTKLV